MELNEIQDLVDTTLTHLLAMNDKVDDLKKKDDEFGNADDKADLPEGFDSYVDGAYQGAVLNLFKATNLLGAKITAMGI